MITDSTYDIYVKILINREKLEAKKIFRLKTLEEIIHETMQEAHERMQEAISRAIKEVIDRKLYDYK